MKRQLCLNRKLYELELFEQNKYLGDKINSLKSIINTNINNSSLRNYPSPYLSKRQSIQLLIYNIKYSQK